MVCDTAWFPTGGQLAVRVSCNWFGDTESTCRSDTPNSPHGPQQMRRSESEVPTPTKNAEASLNVH